MVDALVSNTSGFTSIPVQLRVSPRVFINLLKLKFMSLIRKSSELSIQTNIKMMVYGQAGMGKSTYALSAPKPLLLDFDNGVKRINNAHLRDVDTVQITSWTDIKNVLREDLSTYQTIVVDTIGKMMDYIIDYKCNGGIPNISSWNGINAEFAWFVREISSLNKHIIFVAHRDTRKEGDDTVFIPALREKNYNSIVTELDLLGYIEAKGRIRTITFDPTSRNDGKNTCNLPATMNIPTILDNNGNPTANNTAIMDYVIKPHLARLAAKQEEIAKYNKVIEEIKEQIELITDAESANDFIAQIDNFEHVGSSKVMAAQLVRSKAIALNLKLNSDKKYEPAA